MESTPWMPWMLMTTSVAMQTQMIGSLLLEWHLLLCASFTHHSSDRESMILDEKTEKEWVCCYLFTCSTQLCLCVCLCVCVSIVCSVSCFRNRSRCFQGICCGPIRYILHSAAWLVPRSLSQCRHCAITTGKEGLVVTSCPQQIHSIITPPPHTPSPPSE